MKFSPKHAIQTFIIIWPLFLADIVESALSG